jgi:fatty acid CoA ligase FadD9
MATVAPPQPSEELTSQGFGYGNNAQKEPDPRDAKKAERLKRLLAEDGQIRGCLALDSVNEAKKQPGLRLAQAVQIVMEGYADRPALGQRARALVTDPTTGRKTFRLLQKFETVSYGELWGRARAIASEWHRNAQHPLKAGEFVCVLGFTSIDYATLLLTGIHLGAVNVPLQTSAPASEHAAIIAETEATILCASADYADAAAEAVLKGHVPKRLIFFDYDARDDEQREKVEAARRKLAEADCPIVVDTLDAVIARGKALPEAPLFVAAEGEDPLSWLFYTSGSTGTPKGAMFPESLVLGTWVSEGKVPAITLSFMPMAHLIGNGYLFMAVANGGTSYCSPKGDLSTLFEDLELVRPTMSSLVPRVCELLYHHYLAEVDKKIAAGADAESASQEVKTHMREKLLGGRLLSVGCGSASLAWETYAFMEDMLDMHMPIGYSSTEIAGGTVMVDWMVQRPPVIDYKLDDVPELGYFKTDKPYPRGELLVKSSRFMGGYYKQPALMAEKIDADGFYRTGDVMAEHGPDHLVFVDRRNNVIKLAQGEFVAISKLEALYARSPIVRQIYLYGTSERSFLLAVVVPTEDVIEKLGRDGTGIDKVKAALRRSLLQIAEENVLPGYEIPRDFLIETEPFSQANGLLSEVGKHLRPKLKDKYGARLEAMYAQIAEEQLDELRALRTGGADRPVMETVTRAVQATLGVSASDIRPESKFGELGGDSLSALSFSILLEEIFGLEVPVGMIINPAGNLQQVADYIDAERSSGAKRATFAKVHGAESTTVKASDLTLDKFMDAELLAKAPGLPKATGPIRTVVLTGATGYLGRFQAMAWLERLAEEGGKLICITRGADPAQSRQRLEAALDSDPVLIERFRALAAKHLEALPGDLALPNLGLDEATWARLAETVDLIVHPGAHVNHVLPYNQLFPSNVAGTADLVRLAITNKLKPVHYVSTLGVTALTKGMLDEDVDVREAVPSAELNDSYANGYNVSKWASEVVLREAHEQCGVPVAVFRPGMILAHSKYAGQLNVPDMFTRLLFSLIVTGVAPATFYAQDLSGGRPKARYEGLAVDFLADSITAISAGDPEGYHSYNLSSPHEDGEASLDSFVDWMIDAGCAIERVEKYDEWLSHFETAMLALPEEQKQESLLTLLEPYRQPQRAATRSNMPADRFVAATRAAGYEIPQLSAELISKYVADLRHLELI